ncbi:MAG: hypothetical protein LBG80_17175 [Bacteroidales bacterium]|nr:hypothetical protein [Bacteroidales bacterium]
MRKTIKLRENKRAESRKSIAQGNALCNELHPSPSSPERAKSFVNNRLRPVRGCVKNAPKTIEVVIDRNPRSNEVLPRPNENNMSVERWNNLLILTCHPYGASIIEN